jgi:hypothetical protein
MDESLKIKISRCVEIGLIAGVSAGLVIPCKEIEPHLQENFPPDPVIHNGIQAVTGTHGPVLIGGKVVESNNFGNISNNLPESFFE